MRVLTVALAAVALLSSANSVHAQAKVGQKAPTFSKLSGTLGGQKDITMSSSDFKGKVTALIITCNHCPVAVRYEDKIIKLAEKYSENNKVGVVAINVNNLEADKLPAMKVRAKAKGFNFPYLYDPSQKIARALGARVTPEFYVIDAKGTLVYHGAMDQRGKGSNFVDLAIQATLNGETPKTQNTRAFGCSVKYQR
ncbi:MAG: thioredoxin family protein [Gemmataceae bacterium]